MLLFKVIILQTIVFGLVLFFMKKILWRDTESTVNRLNESYEEVKKKKEELSKIVSELETEYNKRKEEAEKISGQLIEKAKEEGDSAKQELIKAAKKEAEEIIAKALSTIDSMRHEIEQQTQMKIIDFSSQLLQRIFSESASIWVHEIFLKEFIKELKDLDMSRINPELRQIDIISFKALSPEDKQLIRKIICEKLKREITLSESIDAKLMAGLILKFEGLAIDASLAAKIQEAVVETKKKIES